MSVTISGSTGIASVDGSAGSPSVRGSDANSGLFYAADEIMFSVGGEEIAKISEATNGDSLHLGDNKRFTVGGTADSPDCYFYADASNTNLQNITGDMFIRSNADGDKAIVIRNGAGVDLYENNALRCKTTDQGLQIEGGNALFLPAGNWSGDASGKIQGHGTSLYLQNCSTSGYWIFRLPNGTEAASINSSGTYSGSDERRKKDITTITNAVATVKQLTGRSFTWKLNDDKSFGVIAQEIEPVLPDIVSTQSVPEGTTDADPYKMVNYAALSGYFIEAIKELSAEVDALKTKVAALEAA